MIHGFTDRRGAIGSVKGHGVDPLGVTEASMAPSAALESHQHRRYRRYMYHIYI